MLRLHLGCGKRILPGYVNIDIGTSGDMSADIRHLPFEDTSVDEIYASHVLEHFGRHEVANVLSEWSRVLRPGGQIYIAVPNIEAVVAHYSIHKNLSLLRGLLWGGQRDEYDFHKIGFDLCTLSEILTCAGFEKVIPYDTFVYLPSDFDDYSKCYLPHMDRNGTSMSLNVCANKI
jgi:predicted SAM-dependent methyltransferase